MENEKMDSWYESKRDEVIENYITELEERVTNPNAKSGTIDKNWPEMIKNKQKIPYNKEARELLVRVAQDSRLLPDQVDRIQNELMEPELNK